MTQLLTARELMVLLAWVASRMDALADMVPEIQKHGPMDLLTIDLRSMAATIRGFLAEPQSDNNS